MNEPIISPWLIYFIEMTTPLHISAAILGLAFFGAGVICLGNYLTTEVQTYEEYYYKSEEWKEQRRQSDREKMARLKLWLKICFVVSFIFLSVDILVPTKETCYKMLVAQNITKQNVVNAGEVIENALDKAVDKIIKIQSEGKSK